MERYYQQVALRCDGDRAGVRSEGNSSQAGQDLRDALQTEVVPGKIRVRKTEQFARRP